MNKYYYQHPPTFSKKQIGRIIGGLVFFLGICVVAYIFLPLVVWQITLAPVFASQAVAIPIPHASVVSPLTIRSLVTSAVASVGVDYNNPSNWFPGYTIHKGNAKISSYFLSIPALKLSNALVSTADIDIGHHIVQLGGTALPPDRGTSILFGHSTLPSLFDPTNYHTIFANAYKVQVGDEIYATVENVQYRYKVYSILVVDPTDTSVLAQNNDDSYLTIITCTPPGTVWERLVIQSRLEKL